jgi:hypothetical protein
VSDQEKSPAASSTHSDAELQEAEDNLTRCLEAYDRHGDKGLEEELNRIHRPGLNRLRRVPMPVGGPFEGSHSLVLMPDSLDSSTPQPNGSPK